MSGFIEQQIVLMRQACLLCDNSCLDVRTGCLIISFDGFPLAEGWNVEDFSGESSDGVSHAEEVAISKALATEVSLIGTTVYVTRFPCERCSELLVEHGVSRIFYMSDHFTGGNKSFGFLTENAIEVIQLPEEEVWSG